MMKMYRDTFGELPKLQGYYLVEFLKQKEAIVRIKKAKAILKSSANKLFPTEYTYHDTNQTDKEREQKLRLESSRNW